MLVCGALPKPHAAKTTMRSVAVQVLFAAYVLTVRDNLEESIVNMRGGAAGGDTSNEQMRAQRMKWREDDYMMKRSSLDAVIKFWEKLLARFGLNSPPEVLQRVSVLWTTRSK